MQRGVGDKAASQLEKSVTSKLETTVARQIQVQFQTSGKQALQVYGIFMFNELLMYKLLDCWCLWVVIALWHTDSYFICFQDGLRSCLEASIIPAFEMSCKAMFEQVNSAFQKGMAEHTTTATHQIESTNSQLALALRVYVLTVSVIKVDLFWSYALSDVLSSLLLFFCLTISMYTDYY